jgi:hypothetical protein
MIYKLLRRAAFRQLWAPVFSTSRTKFQKSKDVSRRSRGEKPRPNFCALVDFNRTVQSCPSGQIHGVTPYRKNSRSDPKSTRYPQGIWNPIIRKTSTISYGVPEHPCGRCGVLLDKASRLRAPILLHPHLPSARREHPRTSLSTLESVSHLYQNTLLELTMGLFTQLRYGSGLLRS